jgi:hypothetical protein
MEFAYDYITPPAPAPIPGRGGEHPPQPLLPSVGRGVRYGNACQGGIFVVFLCDFLLDITKVREN